MFLASKAFTTETIDNSKNPVARFEGLGSIFREHREKCSEKTTIQPHMLDRISRNYELAVQSDMGSSMTTRGAKYTAQPYGRNQKTKSYHRRAAETAEETKSLEQNSRNQRQEPHRRGRREKPSLWSRSTKGAVSGS